MKTRTVCFFFKSRRVRKEACKSAVSVIRYGVQKFCDNEKASELQLTAWKRGKMEEDIFIRFPDKETFMQYLNENYVPLTYEDVKEAFEDFVTSANGHIYLSDYEENGCISKEDFKENLSQEAQFAFQDALTEAFYEKNPEIYETAFALFEEAAMAEEKRENVAEIFHETYNRLYNEFLDRLFEEKL